MGINMGSTTPKTFNSQIKVLGEFKSDFDKDVIKNEPMFFNSSVEFALENGGPITREFLANLPEEWYNGVFDSRVHMLMLGWYTGIPGWHHDDVPRAIIPQGQHFMTAGQPDYDNLRYKSEHIMGLVNAEVCPTEFIIGECEMKDVPEYGLIYRQWHNELEQMLSENKVNKIQAESGKYYNFDWQTFHACSKAKKSGWRWFGRISRNTERCESITNEIRRQVQVYLEFPMEGW